MNGVPQVNIASLTQAGLGLNQTAKPSGSDNLFHKLVQATNQDQHTADSAIRDFIEGKEGTNIQQVVMAVSEAEMSFQFFMELRNQVIDSYSELMRMQF